MTGGWQVGDLALCVDAACTALLAEGVAYTVTAAFFDPGFNRKAEFTDFTLLLAEVRPSPGRSGFCASRFRKIHPDEQEPCEAEFVTLLKRSRQQVQA